MLRNLSIQAQEACRTLWMSLNAINVFGPLQEGPSSASATNREKSRATTTAAEAGKGESKRRDSIFHIEEDESLILCRQFGQALSFLLQVTMSGKQASQLLSLVLHLSCSSLSLNTINFYVPMPTNNRRDTILCPHSLSLLDGVVDEMR